MTNCRAGGGQLGLEAFGAPGDLGGILLVEGDALAGQAVLHGIAPRPGLALGGLRPGGASGVGQIGCRGIRRLQKFEKRFIRRF